jgi:hypothetical protein
MAELIRIRGAASGYRTILDTLLTKGRTQKSRNGETLEIEDLVIEVADPKQAIIGTARPGYNEAIGAVEGLQLVAGISDSSLTCEIQPNFRAFMDDGKFWGAYGPRTVDQFPIITERLRADPDTRQAVVTLWDPEYDAKGGKQDHPCTTAFNFRIRDGRLNMTTFMRSNDAYWGWPYDVYQFCLVQNTMANVLGVRLGTYTHHAASFHLYEPHFEVAKSIVDGDEPNDAPRYLLVFVDHNKDKTWEHPRDSARRVWHVVRGVAAADSLQTNVEYDYARMLLDRKIKVATKNQDKLGRVRW